MNLLRFRLEEGYAANPFYKYLNSKQRKSFARYGILLHQKVGLINRLGNRASITVDKIFADFFRPELRNAVAHGDYTLTEERFRCRGRTPSEAFEIPLCDLDKVITSAKAFAAAFFILEYEARRAWGGVSGRAFPYDRQYKGLMEVLADEEGLLTGFRVHWPNKEHSYYRRTAQGVDMVNCFLSTKNETVELFVGLYARKPGSFSPLVEDGDEPSYSNIEGSMDVVTWDESAAIAPQPLLPEVDLTRLA